ncbi:unnamed protein product [Orchesella dallaii]|uniref:Uncharacterized protein n=1 Tax=Orchesella dallaii TaxID=48710 RepID=A0ABP1Q4L5_9HEXA
MKMAGSQMAESSFSTSATFVEVEKKMKKHAIFPLRDGQLTKEDLVNGSPPPFSGHPINLLILTLEELQNLLISLYKEFYKKELPDIASSTMEAPPWWTAEITFDKMLKLKPGYCEKSHQDYLVKLARKFYISCGATALLEAEPDSSVTTKLNLDQQRYMSAIGLVLREFKDEPQVSFSSAPDPPVSPPEKYVGRAPPNQSRNSSLSLIQQFSFLPISSSLGQSLLAKFDDQKVEHVYPPPYEKHCEINSSSATGDPIQKYRLRRRAVPEHYPVVTKKKIIKDGRNARPYVFGKSKYKRIRYHRELLEVTGTSTSTPLLSSPHTSTNNDEIVVDPPNVAAPSGSDLMRTFGCGAVSLVDFLKDPGSENFAERMATGTWTSALEEP